MGFSSVGLTSRQPKRRGSKDPVNLGFHGK
jgi:hypothetical protein